MDLILTSYILNFFDLNRIQTELFDKDSQRYIQKYKPYLLSGNGGMHGCHLTATLNAIRAIYATEGKPIPELINGYEKGLKWIVNFLRHNKKYTQCRIRIKL